MSLRKALFQKILRWNEPIVFGDQPVTSPVSRVYGLDRGQAIDRRYIDSFLADSSEYISGRVLEVSENTYTKKFASTSTTCVDVLNPTNQKTNNAVSFDLTVDADVPEGCYDCFVCTHTLNFIFDVRKAVANAYKLLKPGGHLIVTVAGLAQVSRYDMDRWGDFWRFTDLSLKEVLAADFGELVSIKLYGNVFAATSLLNGLAVEDIPDTSLLDIVDADYPVVIGGLATKKA